MADARRWRRWALFLLWVALCAIIVAGLFVAAFFASYAPIEVGDPGAVILGVPILAGFMLGVLLTDEEIVVAAGAGVVAAVLSIVLVVLFMMSPMLAGVAVATTPYAAFISSRIILSTVLLFPLLVVGSVVGRGIGDLFLPSARVQARLDELREETRRWHEALDRLEHRSRNELQLPEEKPPEQGKD